jgi:hypothetical protein
MRQRHRAKVSDKVFDKVFDEVPKAVFAVGF